MKVKSTNWFLLTFICDALFFTVSLSCSLTWSPLMSPLFRWQSLIATLFSFFYYLRSFINPYVTFKLFFFNWALFGHFVYMGTKNTIEGSLLDVKFLQKCFNCKSDWQSQNYMGNPTIYFMCWFSCAAEH